MMNRNQANLDGYADRGQTRNHTQPDHAATRERDPQTAAEPRYGGAPHAERCVGRRPTSRATW